MYDFISPNNPAFPYREVLDLFKNNKYYLKDDYSINDDKDFLDGLIRFSSRHFFAVLYKSALVGVLYLHDWQGAENNYHSCYLSGFAKKKTAQHTEKALKELCFYLFERHKLFKITAKTDKNNKPAQFCLKRAGFRHESTLYNTSFRDKKPVDVYIYAVYKGG